ncbi:MAG: glucose-1-phosphate thymidylyltransferase RfbA [Streptomycetaceae bacterium]|nr:glucose-1-phosphate thymidylyltransferase RfbA [Streptomycetaceae bacterium]
MRGILLAGGSGARLRPLTSVLSKHLLPVYDKPMIYYPLSVLMSAGIRDILLISSPEHVGAYADLLGDGRQWGIRLEYAVQDAPNGLAEALLIGAPFIGRDTVCLALGDNIFHGRRLPLLLRAEAARVRGCTLFGHPVPDPERFGVATVAPDGHVLTLEEKPAVPRSNLAVTGLYLYDANAARYAADLVPSARGELEITDLNLRYVREGRARLVGLGPGAAWFDTGTDDSLLEAARFVQVLEKRRGSRVCCPEEVAFRMGFIDAARLCALGEALGDASAYGRYLREVAAGASRRAAEAAEYYA